MEELIPLLSICGGFLGSVVGVLILFFTITIVYKFFKKMRQVISFVKIFGLMPPTSKSDKNERAIIDAAIEVGLTERAVDMGEELKARREVGRRLIDRYPGTDSAEKDFAKDQNEYRRYVASGIGPAEAAYSKAYKLAILHGFHPFTDYRDYLPKESVEQER